MYGSNIPQPGQINYDKQQALLEGMPNNTSSLQEIQKLLSNPTSPFAQFLLLGKQEQINKALAADARQKALQGDQGGPPPTIAQKTQQMSGILALQNAQRNAMGAPVPGAVVPSGGIPHPVPQPSATPNMGAQEEQAEPEQAPTEQAAAGGGIMHAPVDSRMFNFADGGIVAFAGKDDDADQQKQVVKDPQAAALSAVNSAMPEDMPSDYSGTLSKYLADRNAAINAVLSNVAVPPQYKGPRQETYAERDIRMHNQPDIYNAANDRLSLANITKMLGLTQATPDEVNQAHASAWGNKNLLYPVPGVMTAQGPTANNNPNQPIQSAPFDDTSVMPVDNTPANPGLGVKAVTDPKQRAILEAIQNTQNGKPAPVAAPGASAAPAAGAPGISGLPKLQSSNVDATPAGILKLTNALKMANPFEAKAEAAYSSAAPEAYDQAKEIKRIQDENKAFEVGKFSENRRAQLDNLEKMFQANRPSTLEQLLELGHTYSSRGARFGDVGATGAKQMREEREAQMQFAQAKDKALEAIEKEDQAIRIGNVSDLRAARKDKDKAIQEWKNQGATLYESLAKTRGSSDAAAQQTAAHIIGQQINGDFQLRSAQLHLLAAQVTANKPSETERFEQHLHDVYDAAEKAKPGSGNAAVNAATQMRIQAAEAAQGRKYTQPDKKVEHENMIQTQIDKRVGNIDLQLQGKNLKQADRDKLLAARREIEKDVRRQFPFRPDAETTTPPPADKDQVYQPRTEDDIKNIPSGAIFVNPADGKRYKKN